MSPPGMQWRGNPALQFDLDQLKRPIVVYAGELRAGAQRAMPPAVLNQPSLNQPTATMTPSP